MGLGWRWRRGLLLLPVLALLLLLPGPSTTATAARLDTVSPDAVAMDPAVLDDLTRALQNLTDQRFIPGATVVIARRGKIVYDTTVGYARKDMLFRLFSMSKLITTAAVLLLVQDGKLRLDDPVCTHVPQLANLRVIIGDQPRANFYHTVPARSPITVHQLLSHTSGFVYGYTNTTVDELFRRELLAPYAWKRMTLEHFVTALARLPLLFHPGTHAWYSVGFDVLGYVVERVSGVPFEQFLATRVFAPLGMVDTDFWVPPDKAHRLVPWVYTNGTSGVPAFTMPDSEFFLNGYLTNPWLKLGGQGLVSTGRDYMAFCLMLYNGGTYEEDGTGITKRLLRADLVEHFFQDAVPELKPFAVNRVPHPNLTFAYGPQLQMVETGAAVKGEIEEGGLANTKIVISRERELVMLTLCNKLPFPNLAARAVREHAYSAQRDFPPKQGHDESALEDTDRSLLQSLPFFQHDNPYYVQNQVAKYRRLGAAAGGREKEDENVGEMVRDFFKTMRGEADDDTIQDDVEIAAL